MAEINTIPAPKNVTVWHCRLLASYVKLRRPRRLQAFWQVNGGFEPQTLALRLRNANGKLPQAKVLEYPKPDGRRLFKVGRKKLTNREKLTQKRARKARMHSPGLTMPGNPRRTRENSERRFARKARDARIRNSYAKGTTAMKLAVRYGLALGTITRICNGVRAPRYDGADALTTSAGSPAR